MQEEGEPPQLVQVVRLQVDNCADAQLGSRAAADAQRLAVHHADQLRLHCNDTVFSITVHINVYGYVYNRYKSLKESKINR